MKSLYWLRNLFTRKKKRVVRACRSKLILNVEEGEFCELVGTHVLQTGSSEKAIRFAAAEMGLALAVAREWFNKPKIQRGIASVQEEESQKHREDHGDQIAAGISGYDVAGGPWDVPPVGARIVPAEE